MTNSKSKQIRFINSKYDTLFTIMDGESIRLTRSDGQSAILPCKFIDEYHMQLGNNVYHICEFAEKMEQNGIFYAPMPMQAERQAEMEKRFLKTAADSFAIYQLKQDRSTHDLFCEPLDRLLAAGKQVERSNYEIMYVAPLTRPAHLLPDEILDRIYERFNIRRPLDFHGHSLSMSDVVALKMDGKVFNYYVDRFGFSSLPNFQRPNELVQSAQTATQDDFDRIKGIIHDGTPSTAAEENRVMAEKKARLSVETFPLVSFEGKPALLSDWRVDASLLPEGMYHYDLRHGDGWGTPITLENHVRVNFFGTLLMTEPVQLPADGRMNLAADALDYLDDEYLSISDFQKGHAPVQEERSSVLEKLKNMKAVPAKIKMNIKKNEQER